MTSEKIQRAMAKLMLEEPLLASVASTLRYEADETILTFQSDGATLRYNPQYLDIKAKDFEVVFALANGAMHAMLGHYNRAGKRVERLWRAASDLVVNAILVQNGFTLPADAYYNEQYAKMYVEEVYERLIEEMRTNDTLDASENGEAPDSIHETPPQKSEKKEPQATSSSQEASIFPISEQVYTDDERAAFYEQLFEKYRKRNEIPQALRYALPDFFSHRIDWRQALYRYLSEFAKNTYRFTPPNAKHLYRGVALPASTSDLLRLVIAVDTSGSVDDETLRMFLGEVESIMQTYGNYEIELIAVDDRIRSHRTYIPGERLEYRAEGRGATDFRALFSYVDHHIDYPAAVLYFTDMQGVFPDTPPPYDVLWVVANETHDAPFGEILVIDG